MESSVQLELVRPGPALDARKDDIWRILEATDHDFVPPLSQRTPTTLGELRTSRLAFALPIEHVEFQLGMHIVFASVDGRTVGYLSYLPDFRHEVIDELDSAVLIDTVAVLPGWRRKGVARALYAVAFASEEFERTDHAVLHTWSTNVEHGGLIHRLGFEEIRRIPNERAPGIDTLIYLRPTRPNPFDIA